MPISTAIKATDILNQLTLNTQLFSLAMLSVFDGRSAEGHRHAGISVTASRPLSTVATMR